MRGRGNPGEHFHGRRIIGHPRGNVRRGAGNFHPSHSMGDFRRERRRVIIPPNRYNGGIPPISPYPHHHRRGGCCGCFPVMFIFFVIAVCILAELL